MNGKKHIVWIDDARTLTMLLVIIGHCTYTNLKTPYGGISYYDNLPSQSISLIWKLLGTMVAFIYTFHMPLFMLLSGACFALTINKFLRGYDLIQNKAKRLLIPFLYTSLLVSIPLKYISGYYINSVNVLKDIVFGQLLLMGNSHLWFVFSLFWIFLISYILYKFKLTEKRFFLLFLFGISLFATFVNNKGYEFMGVVAAMKHLFYFFLGFLYLHKFDSLKWGGITLLLNSLGYIVLFLFIWEFGKIDTYFVRILRYVFTIVMGIYGSVIMIQISKNVQKLPGLTKNTIYRTFSKHSYELYLFSDPFNYVLVYIMYELMGNYVEYNFSSLLSFFVRFLGTITLAFVVIWIKNRIFDIFISYGKFSKS